MDKKKEKRIVWTATILLMLVFAGWIVYYFFIIAPLPTLTLSNSRRVKITNNPAYFEGRFTWRVNKILNSETEVLFIIPKDPATDKPLKSASNIIFYAPFAGAGARIKKNGMPDWIKYLAFEKGYTVFTFSIIQDELIRSDMKNYYIYQSAGWYELIYKAIDHIANAYGLDSSSIYIVGESSGGSMAQRMTVANPKRVKAAAWLGGSKYLPYENDLNVPTLALSTWGCYGESATENTIRRGVILGNNMLFSEAFPNGSKQSLSFEHHGASPQSYQAIQLYIDGIIKLSEQNNGIIPPRSLWPVKLSGEFGELFLPSEEFGTIWGQLASQCITIDPQNKWQREFPMCEKPEAVVLLLFSSSDSTIRIKDTLYFLFLNNYVGKVVWVDENDVKGSLDTISQAINEIDQDGKIAKLPRYLTGMNMLGNLAFQSATLPNAKKLAKVIAMAPFLWDDLDAYPSYTFPLKMETPVEVLHSKRTDIPENISGVITIKSQKITNDRIYFETLKKSLSI